MILRLLCTLALVAALVPAARADDSVAAARRSIAAADARVQNAEVIWDETLVTPPDPSHDPARDAAQILAWDRAQGESDSVAQSNAQNALEEGEQLRVGNAHRFVKRYRFSRGAVELSDWVVRPGDEVGAREVPNRSPDSRFLAVGVDRLVMSETGTNRTTKVVGSLQRTPDVLLSFGSGDKTLLCLPVGAPISDGLSSSNSTLRVTPGGSVLIERQHDSSDGQWTYLERAHISRQIWRLVSLDNIDARDNSVISRWSGKDWRLRPGGVWFPSIVEYDRLSSRGQIMARDTYRLVRATFNAPAGFMISVPSGAVINDFRFSPDPTVRYVVRDRMPTDQEVRRMVAERKKELADLQSYRRRQAVDSALYMAGGPLVVVLIVLMAARRARRRCR